MSDPDRPHPSARSTAVAEHGEDPATDVDAPTTTAGTATTTDRSGTDAAAEDPADVPARRRRRTSVPLAPLLGVLLLLLLAGNAYLLAPRLFGEESSVRTGTYVDVLQAARSDVVDLTSFDYLTIDDDIEQARRVTTGDLTDESVSGLEGARQQIVDAQAVTSSEVVGAGVTRATEDEGTVVMVIATTRQAAGVPAQVRRDRIEVDLQREGDRWLLSAIRGTGSDD
ncbi:hypothetical protein [Blastococcus sp. URHD0036]|uniref:hypothetical protein n=1 Tax=Blastococcus sp. URHD0036 TaxID=1380356 RepID=UPI000495D69A|nr:hypothetical protein [Blastococcus sp. URHD0036]